MSQDLEPNESVSQVEREIDFSEPMPTESESNIGSTASFMSRFTKQTYPEHYLLVTNDPVALTRANSIIQVSLTQWPVKHSLKSTGHVSETPQLRLGPRLRNSST